MIVDTVAGFSSGNTIVVNRLNRDAPSMYADSSISTGTLFINPEYRNTENGSEQVINISIGVNLVFGMPSLDSVCAIGTITICDGMIRPEIKKKYINLASFDLILPIGYAAIVAIITITSTEPAVVIKLFKNSIG